MKTNTVRVFLAAEPSPEVLDRIGLLQKKLARLYPSGIKWVDQESVHLTLKFFGQIPEKMLIAIKEIIEKELVLSQKMNFSVEKLGFFPSSRHPRVIWLGLKGDLLPLSELRDRLERGFTGLGFLKDNHPFTPHLTLGRVKANIHMEDLSTLLKDEEIDSIGGFTVDKLYLYKSELTPQGARYSKLICFPLGVKK